MNQLPSGFWCISAAEILQHLGTAKEGLSSKEARRRLSRYGSNLLKPQKRSEVLPLLLAQFKSPLILILLFATGAGIAKLPVSVFALFAFTGAFIWSVTFVSSGYFLGRQWTLVFGKIRSTLVSSSVGSLIFSCYTFLFCNSFAKKTQNVACKKLPVGAKKH